MGSFLDTGIPILSSIIGNLIFPGAGALIGAGLGSFGTSEAEGQGFGKSLEHGALSAGGSFLGSNIGSALAPAGQAAGGIGGGISGSGAVGGLSGDTLAGVPPGVAGLVGDGLGDTPSLAGSGSIGSTLGSGAGQTAGQSGGSVFGGGLGSAGTIGSNLNATLGPNIGGQIGSLIGPTTAGTGIGSIAGGSIGSQLAQGLAGPPNSPDTSFHPSRMTASTLPSSLNDLSGLSSGQQASNLATQGTFGGGLGPQEQSYYANLLNRQLIDQSGNVQPISSLSPIESTFNQQLGFGNNTNSTDLLKALSTWSPN